MMEVALHIPDDVAKQIRQVNEQDIARHILEEDAIRTYQERTLGESHLRRYSASQPAMSLRSFSRPIMFIGTIRWKTVKPKATQPVSMLEQLMQHAPKIGRCIAPQMHVGSAHPGLHGVVRYCTPLASD
jgi:hypothetical protein